LFQKQDNKMQDLNDLYYFAKVVEHGGFMAASRVAEYPSRACRVALPNWKNGWVCACCSAPLAACR
jgi:hypothetical protein